ncbi:MAG: sensor histidine kinase [Crocinitomicaceae bacterium]
MRTLLFILTLFATVQLFGQSTNHIDSLEGLLDDGIHDTARVYTYSELCWEYRVIDQTTALEYGQKAVQLARKIPFKKGLGNALNDLSIIYIDKGSLDTAVTLLEEAKEIRSELGDETGLAAIHNKLGIIYEHLVQLEKAMINHMAALDYYESIDNKVNMGFCLNNIANVHFKLKNYEKAEEIHQKALHIRTSIGDSYGIAGSHSNLANLMMTTGDTSQAIHHFNKAIQVYRQHNFENDLAVTLNNLGTLQLGLGEIDKAETSISEAYEIRVRLNDKRGICSSSIVLGEIYLEKGDYTKASKYLHTGLQLSKESGYENKEKGAYEKLAKLHTKLKQADSVYYYYSQFYRIEHEQYRANLNEQVNELQTIYETEKKDKENEKLAREKAEETAKRQAAELKVANRNNWIITIIAITLILLFLALFLYQRRMRHLQQEKSKAILKEKEKGLKAVFDATEKERQRISKDLHDGVGQQMSGLKLAWENLSIEIAGTAPVQAEKIESLGKILNNTANEVREISHQMMPKVLTSFGLVPAIEQLLDTTFHLTDISHHFESFNISERFSERVELSLYRITQELVNNIIKHSGATEMTVQLFKNKDLLLLIIEDNGSGFDQDQLTAGHGLMNIKSRLNTIQGEINYETNGDRGTMVRIRVHLKAEQIDQP